MGSGHVTGTGGERPNISSIGVNPVPSCVADR